MCVCFFGIKAHPQYPLILAFNRDEFHDRSSTPAAYWQTEDGNEILGGRDGLRGGTWFAVHPKTKRWGLLTNIRAPSAEKRDRSRGELVPQFLDSSQGPEGFLKDLNVKALGELYGGFNLLLGEGAQDVFYFSSRSKEVMSVPSGVHGLSNGRLNEPWPKVTRGKELFSRLLSKPPAELSNHLFKLLEDRQRPSEGDLPSTGISLEWEKNLSSILIETETYGTQSSGVFLIGDSGSGEFQEKIKPAKSEDLAGFKF